ncbi:FUSC family protein [Streptomyces sp. NEAU-YJ-81]|nr:FUSC family protein [Streptomyces sp. NEAU-YJ-81]
MRAEFRAIADAVVRTWRGPGRERDVVVQALKAAAAATLAWAISGWWLKDPVALMAPWVAVVLVQATVYRSLSKGLQQLVAIVMGTLLAAGAGLLTGNTMAAVALVLPVAMLLSYWPKLGDQGIYGPTTALFTLTSGAMSGVTMSHRLLQALLGAAIGIAINALILPPVHLRDVREHLAGLAHGTGDTLASIADGLNSGEWDTEATARWRQQSARLRWQLESLRSARLWSHESMRWNPRRRRDPGHRTPLPPESEDQRWGAIVAHLSALTGTMTDIADESRTIPVPDRQRLRDFGHVLAQLATACHARGDLSCRPMADDNAHSQLSENLAGLERYHTDLHKKLTDEQSVSTSTIAVLGTLLIQAQNIWHEIVPEHRPPNISPSDRPGL